MRASGCCFYSSANDFTLVLIRKCFSQYCLRENKCQPQPERLSPVLVRESELQPELNPLPGGRRPEGLSQLPGPAGGRVRLGTCSSPRALLRLLQQTLAVWDGPATWRAEASSPRAGRQILWGGHRPLSPPHPVSPHKSPPPLCPGPARACPPQRSTRRVQSPLRKAALKLACGRRAVPCSGGRIRGGPPCGAA